MEVEQGLNWCVGTSVNEPHLPHICSRLEASTKFWSQQGPPPPPPQSNLWLQQQPANDAGCFTVAAIGDERVCMFRMRGCPPTLTNHICHVIQAFLSLIFFPFIFWEGEVGLGKRLP